MIWFMRIFVKLKIFWPTITCIRPKSGMILHTYSYVIINDTPLPWVSIRHLLFCTCTIDLKIWISDGCIRVNSLLIAEDLLVQGAVLTLCLRSTARIVSSSKSSVIFISLYSRQYTARQDNQEKYREASKW